MKKLVRWGQALVVAGSFAIMGAGLLAISTGVTYARKGPCICPKIYAPVVCKGGKVFSNQCVADCRNAKDCEPLGTL